ncbi:antibiotic biosynthesis monooxygenase family protein [Nocardia sp. XZ_19_369]|uniref:putative quinol monooxygenase n=1 Tax=Nocardia sp. XZ_19_369 TaxID=2769487 RepID=UPI00188DCBD9|nr:antibiotic biosynthesis monooxygenase family protein [Nocardia sp. XZ_19_369]
MLIVAGYLKVTDRDRYLAACREVVELARGTDGCLDFTLGADLVEPDRVNIYERWTTRDAVDKFRGSGTTNDLGAHIVGAEVSEFECANEVRL